jgi:hypothetical protein
MAQNSLTVVLVLCLMMGSAFATTVKTLNRIVFADQFCSTQGVQDQSCVINAINSLPSSGGLVILPYGVTTISSTVVVHKSNVLLIGHDAEVDHDIGSLNPATDLVWTGTSGGTMFTFSAIAGSENQRLGRSGIVQAHIDCEGSAATAIVVRSEYFGRYDDLNLYNCTAVAIDVGVVPHLGEAADSQHNDFRNISIRNLDNAGGKGTAFRLRGDSSANSSFNTFTNIMVVHMDGNCLELDNSDNNVYMHFRCFRASGGTGTGVLLQGTPFNQAARNEYFFHLEPGQGGLTQAQSSTGNVVIGYDQSNGSPSPNIKDGTLTWTSDGLNGTGWHIPVVNTTSLRTATALNSDAAGQIVLSGGSGSYPFSGIYVTPPVCTASDTSAKNAVMVSTTNTGLTVTGTGSDTINYICLGRD